MTEAARKAQKAAWPDVALRTMAAVPLNYVCTALLTVLLARILPGSPAQASIAATLFTFAIFASIAMAAFAVRSVTKLWLALIAVAAAAALADWLLIATGGRL